MRFQRTTALFLLAFLATGSAQTQAAPRLEGGLDDGVAATQAAPRHGGLMLDIANIAVTPAALPLIDSISTASRVRQLLADFSMTLRDIRYRRGGREPSTGFDCSGFVSYVFRHSLGKDLPSDSASQFLAGAKVDRADMQTGDLVFFRTRGKRISHVGIYLGDGRFIHSPSTGKRVSISSLDEAYWAHRFAGAKRPDGLS